MGCSSVPTPSDEDVLTTTYLDKHQVQALSDHLQALSADYMAGRGFASAGSIEAQNYIITSLVASNVEPFQQKFSHPFEHNTFLSQKIGTNIIGWVRGTVHPEQYIVLSAHYDHLGIKDGKIYNGADDNASGIAALLTFGQAIVESPLKYSVIFLFTDGEEVNLLGAKAFIEQQKALLSDIKLNINIDMIAGNSNTKMLHYIDKQLETILPENQLTIFHGLTKNSSIRIKRNFKRDSHRTNSKPRWNNASDHAAFTRQRIPFIYYGVGEHKNYHSIDDDFNNVNIHFFIHACQSIFQYLTFLDDNIK